MRLQLPVKGTIDGIAVVIVSAEEYARLPIAAPASPVVTGPSPDRPAIFPEVSADRIIDHITSAKGRPAEVFYDREVAGFLIAWLGTMPDSRLVADCARRFGADRAPSPQAMSRFAMRVRAVRRQIMGVKAEGSDARRSARP